VPSFRLSNAACITVCVAALKPVANLFPHWFNLDSSASVCSVCFGRLLFSVHERSLTVTTNSMEFGVVLAGWVLQLCATCSSDPN